MHISCKTNAVPQSLTQHINIHLFFFFPETKTQTDVDGTLRRLDVE